MIVDFKGKAISSVAFEHNEGKLPALIINTHDKWVSSQSTESGVDYLQFNYKFKSYVKLCATTDIEIEILNRLRFESNCKDQRVILFIPDDIL